MGKTTKMNGLETKVKQALSVLGAVTALYSADTAEAERVRCIQEEGTEEHRLVEGLQNSVVYSRFNKVHIEVYNQDTGVAIPGVQVTFDPRLERGNADELDRELHTDIKNLYWREIENIRSRLSLPRRSSIFTKPSPNLSPEDHRLATTFLNSYFSDVEMGRGILYFTACYAEGYTQEDWDQWSDETRQEAYPTNYPFVAYQRTTVPVGRGLDILVYKFNKYALSVIKVPSGIHREEMDHYNGSRTEYEYNDTAEYRKAEGEYYNSSQDGSKDVIVINMEKLPSGGNSKISTTYGVGDPKE